MNLPVKFEDVENKIIQIREQPVIIDSDLAQLYIKRDKLYQREISHGYGA